MVIFAARNSRFAAIYREFFYIGGSLYRAFYKGLVILDKREQTLLQYMEGSYYRACTVKQDIKTQCNKTQMQGEIVKHPGQNSSLKINFPRNS